MKSIVKPSPFIIGAGRVVTASLPPSKLCNKNISILLTKGLGDHKYCSLIVKLPPQVSKFITDWSSEHVLEDHLGPSGRELDPHITVKYGFTDGSEETVQKIRALLGRHGPIQIRLRDLAFFARENKNGIPLYISVDSPELVDLNRSITELFDAVDSYPEYIPHVTIAYLSSPEIARTYASEGNPFANVSCVIEEAVWSDKNKTTTRIPMSFMGSGLNTAIDSYKDLSYLSVSSGGALVPPSAFSLKKKKKVKNHVLPVSLLRNRAALIGKIGTKGAGQPCKRGETAKKTGCIPTGPIHRRSTFYTRSVQEGKEEQAKRTAAERKETRPTSKRSRSFLSEFIRIGKTPWRKIRATGKMTVEVEHAIKEWIKDKIQENLTRLPPRAQATVRGAWLAIRLGGKTTFATYMAGQSLAEKVSKNLGSTEEEARRLRAILSIIDIASYKPVAISIAALVDPTLAVMGSLIPIGSLTYLAYSTARHPIKTMQAALRAVRSAVEKKALEDGSFDAEELSRWLRGEDADYKMALYLAALDLTKDAGEAFSKAVESYGIRTGSTISNKRLLLLPFVCKSMLWERKAQIQPTGAEEPVQQEPPPVQKRKPSAKLTPKLQTQPTAPAQSKPAQTPQTPLAEKPAKPAQTPQTPLAEKPAITPVAQPKPKKTTDPPPAKPQPVQEKPPVQPEKPTPQPKKQEPKTTPKGKVSDAWNIQPGQTVSYVFGGNYSNIKVDKVDKPKGKNPEGPVVVHGTNQEGKPISFTVDAKDKYTIHEEEETTKPTKETVPGDKSPKGDIGETIEYLSQHISEPKQIRGRVLAGKLFKGEKIISPEGEIVQVLYTEEPSISSEQPGGENLVEVFYTDRYGKTSSFIIDKREEIQLPTKKEIGRKIQPGVGKIEESSANEIKVGQRIVWPEGSGVVATVVGVEKDSDSSSIVVFGELPDGRNIVTRMDAKEIVHTTDEPIIEWDDIPESSILEEDTEGSRTPSDVKQEPAYNVAEEQAILWPPGKDRKDQTIIHVTNTEFKNDGVHIFGINNDTGEEFHSVIPGNTKVDIFLGIEEEGILDFDTTELEGKVEEPVPPKIKPTLYKPKEAKEYAGTLEEIKKVYGSLRESPEIDRIRGYIITEEPGVPDVRKILPESESLMETGDQTDQFKLKNPSLDKQHTVSYYKMIDENPDIEKILYTYTLETGWDYNASLRGEGGNQTIEVSVRKEAIYLGRSLLKHAPEIAPGTILHREIALTRKTKAELYQSTGRVLQDPGFISSSTEEIMGGHPSVIFKYTASKGTRGLYIAPFSSFGTEKEVLFPPGQRFLITNTEKKGDRLIVHAILLPTVPEQFTL
jgi:2'-5' RNA ligase